MFSTGEFSRIARVSKRLLQFYDEEGLFRPAFTDPQTGYRRYRADQLSQLNRVLALKELGLSLSEIRQVLSRNTTDAEVRQMLKQKQAELEQSVQEGLQRLRALETRLGNDPALPDVVLKSIPACSYVYRDVRLDTVALAWRNVTQIAADVDALVPRRAIDAVSLCMPGDGFETSNTTVEMGVLLKPGAPVPQLANGFQHRVLAARDTVATAILQSGGPEFMHRVSGAIGRWIESQGYTMVGAPREVFIGYPLTPLCENAVVESQFEVVSPAREVSPDQ